MQHNVPTLGISCLNELSNELITNNNVKQNTCGNCAKRVLTNVFFMTKNENFNRLYNLRIIVKHDFQCGLISKITLEHQLKRLNNLLLTYIK